MLKAMPRGSDSAEADRKRAILLTFDSWTSIRMAEAFGVYDDTVRLWRSTFLRGEVDTLRASNVPGPMPLKAAAALRVAEPLLNAPGAGSDRAG